MSPGATLANENMPLIPSDTDCEIFGDAISNMKDKADATKSKRASLLASMPNTERSPTRAKTRYESVGELMWGAGGAAYSDVRLTFEDRGVLAARTGIPTELRLHSIVLFESQFFREQLSCTLASPSSPVSHMRREKQIIVRLPPRVSEEDLTCFYSTLKLMYTKAWDEELEDNLAKAVGCLSVSCEIGFHEGMEACWRWLAKKCLRERNREMLRRLIEAYPDLYERFGDCTSVETANQTSQSLRSDSPYLSVPSAVRRPSPKRPAPVVRRSSSRRKQRTAPHARRRTGNNGKHSALANSNSNTAASSSASSSATNSIAVASTSAAAATPMRRSNYSEESLTTNASASPITRYDQDMPSPTLGYYNDEPSTSSSSPADEASSATALAVSAFPSPMLSPVTSEPSKDNQQMPSPVNSGSTTPVPEMVTVVFPVAPSMPPPMEFSTARELTSWLRKFETFSITAKRACASLPGEARLDSRCFPFLEHFSNVLRSIGTLALRGLVQSQEALDMTLRMLNVIKIEHNHYHSLHLSPQQTPSEDALAPPIVLHESLDAPLALILRHTLAPNDQKHLIDFLWAPSNISNLMHLHAVRGRISGVPSDADSGNEDMNEDEFSEMDEVMSEESLRRASRISQVEHMVVGERMAEAMREMRGRAYRMI